VKNYVAFLKSSKPSAAGGEVLIPGEKEQMVMADRQANGLPMAGDAWNDIVATAAGQGMSDSDIESLLAKV
jgi:uncharacterized oxidoreductase